MKNILIVDGERRIRNVYKLLLTSYGYNTFEARNAAEAKGLLAQEKIDLMLLDSNLPDAKGFVLYDVMQLFYCDVKTIVCSAYPVAKQRLLIPDATAYYDKTKSIEDLFIKIQTALNDDCPAGKHTEPALAC